MNLKRTWRFGGSGLQYALAEDASKFRHARPFEERKTL
jgi:hypothetical protein